jgi:hypothetical protein
MARTILAIFAALLFSQGALSLQLPARKLSRPATPLRCFPPAAQFGGGPKSDKPQGLSRDSEPEDFFKTNMGELGPAICARPGASGAPPCFRAPAHAREPSPQPVADSMSDSEKLKSPLFAVGLGILVFPFIVGMIALGFSK